MNKRIRKKQAKKRWLEKQRLEKEFWNNLKQLSRSKWSGFFDGDEWKVVLEWSK